MSKKKAVPVSPEMLAIIADCAHHAGQDNLCVHLGCLAIWLQDNPDEHNRYPDDPVITKKRWQRADKLIYEVRKLGGEDPTTRLGGMPN